MATLYYAVLSGAHPTLPEAELRGILEALGHRYRIVERLDLLAVFHCSCPSSRGVAYRAGLVQETGRLLAAAEARMESVLEAALALDWCNVLEPGDRVRVELRRLKGYAKKTIPGDAARRLAAELAPLFKRCGAEASPRRPTKTLVLLVTQGVALIGLREDEKPDQLLESHRPQRRPFFHPGSLDPRLARLFVNLSRARPPGPYLDPFCGTGGFPLEAQTLGIPSICGELDKKLAEGAWRNLKAYPGDAYTATIQWDATRLPLRDESIQAIGTDPPYGRSISLRGKQLQELHEGFIHEAARVLKKGAYLAMAAPHWSEETLEDLAREAGLQVIEKHYQKVHGSLARIIVVAKKA